ncbi:MAG: histidine phosphatase family protein [Bacteroidales bacterium]|jgi:2,3-bisphosphoglycerate-dependent phosphoglycerate mutase|nr:histidine phosphatase family protein [Bacteroidales bacterium]
MLTIYFIRHAQPDLTVHEDAIRPLTDKGLQDRELVTQYLSDKNINAIFSSPYQRTIETISHFAEKFKLDINYVDDFRERKIGCWVEDIDAFYLRQWRDHNFKLENGESLIEAQSRVIHALEKILKQFNNHNLVISTHGFVLSALINYYDSLFGIDDFLQIVKIMPFVSKFSFENNKCVEINSLNLFNHENLYHWRVR